MANVITPKLSSAVPNFNVKLYNYGGSTQTAKAVSIYDNYESLDYNYNSQDHIAEIGKDEANTAEKVANGLYKAYSYTGTVLVSVGVSMTYGIIEDITDGLIMAGGFILSKEYKAISLVSGLLENTKFGKAFKLDNISERFDKMSQQVEGITQNVVQYDWSEAKYDQIAKNLRIDDAIAHGKAHTISNAVGTVAGYVAIGALTGGASAIVMPTIGAASAAGSSAQKAFLNGATFNQAALNAGVSAAIGAASGATMSGLGSVASGAKSGLQAAGLTVAGAAAGAATPAITSAVEYNTYGKNNYLSYNDYAKATGAYKSMIVGGTVGAVVVGGQAVQGVNAYKRVNDDEKWTNLTPEEKVDAVRDYDRRFSKEETGIGASNKGVRREDYDNYIDATGKEKYRNSIVEDDDAYYGYRINEKQASCNDQLYSETDAQNLGIVRKIYNREEAVTKPEVDSLLAEGRHREAAEKAFYYRDANKVSSREIQENLGLSTEGLKQRNQQMYGGATSGNFESRVAKVAEKMFGDSVTFNSLTVEQQNQVYDRIAQSAYEPNPAYNMAAGIPPDGKWWG